MSSVTQIQVDNFDEFLQFEGPVLIDFTATWCGPCRMISPAIDQLAVNYEGRARVAKVDVDESAAIAKRFEIRSIPAVLVFRDGVVKERLVGVSTYEKFSATLEQYL